MFTPLLALLDLHPLSWQWGQLYPITHHNELLRACFQKRRISEIHCHQSFSPLGGLWAKLRQLLRKWICQWHQPNCPGNNFSFWSLHSTLWKVSGVPANIISPRILLPLYSFLFDRCCWAPALSWAALDWLGWQKQSRIHIIFYEEEEERRVNRASHILQCGTLLQDMIFSYIYLPTMGQRTSYLIVCMQMSMFYLEGGHQSRLECQNNLTTTLGKNICRIQKNFTRPKNSIWSIEWIFCHAIF